MPVGHWNLEWLNHNSQRNYPLADDADGVDDSASFTLPTDFIVELDLPISAGVDVDPAQFYIKHIGAYATGYSVIVGYQPSDGSDPVNVASALIPRLVQDRNTAYALGGIGDFSDSVGKIVIGRLDNIDEQPPGFWTFSLIHARLDPDAVRPIIRGVSSIQCVNGEQTSVKLYGVIQLVAGSNMSIVPILVAGQNPIIRFNAIQGDGTIDECFCTGDAALTPPIKTINGVGPTNAGDFNFVGTDCLQVTQTSNGVRFDDKCAQPCCGCAELERITQDLERLNIQAATTETFLQSLQNTVDSFQATVLGSKLNDNSCIACS